MRELKIGKNDAGGRLDSFLLKAYKLPSALIYKYIRLKRIKLNGKRAAISNRLAEGDILQLYINDELLEQKKGPSEAFMRVGGKIDITYEDENILIVNKPAGMSVHEDESGEDNTLINNIQRYLFDKDEWNPAEENHFTPALANRIDRNTQGLVMAAKNEAALRALNEKIRLREVEKTYLAVCVGRVEPQNGILEGYIFKDEKSKRVYVRQSMTKGAKTARMSYKRLRCENGLSLVECLLDTGRTHQIRAQMAEAGFPLLGDGKYGSGDANRKYGVKYQALCSHGLKFAFKEGGGVLHYLTGRSFKGKTPEFVARLFPGFGEG